MRCVKIPGDGRAITPTDITTESGQPDKNQAAGLQSIFYGLCACGFSASGPGKGKWFEYMKRMIDLSQVSDGRLYSSGDMVRADCRDCRGCSDCCRGMGGSILLDPMDVWRFQTGLHRDFQSLLEKEAELGMADGMILPNLKMDAKSDACLFLDENGRCSVHEFRPGLCRLFPLGRYYEENGFRYFLQIHECRNKERGKVKIKKWLGIPDLKAYETYILSWHDFLEQCREGAGSLDGEKRRILALYVLRTFFETPFRAGKEEEFYSEFSQRLEEAGRTLGF